ncbi:hypothetical protein [Actinophytocola oryzae]|uniref:Bifunctional DNA primase/polymerase-like protein n=1 Tax=Actinophytocola oryzae TaxID=502181 RepID=A0A4R7VX61_9PSEU|nr:hypothetical protein [Actinophytocola oryzae]TDV54238.1 hypothetical protein CLV71_104709 [Actinophytocola oryzae]
MRLSTTDRRQYEALLGESSSPTGRPVVVVGEDLDAIVMPVRFGELVHTQLRLSMLDGPIVVGPDRDHLTFLTQPAATRYPLLPADLRPFRVWLVPSGGVVVLPSGDGAQTWRVPPALRTPPLIWSAVVGTARRVAASCATEWTVPDPRSA